MKGTLLVLRRDWRDMRLTAAFRIMVGTTAAIAIVASGGITVGLRLQPWYGETGATPVVGLIVGLVAYFLPLFILIAFIWAFASLPVAQEKANGNIEALLATPLAPTAIWVGKCLAVFVPGYVLSLVASCLVLVVVNLGVVLPGWGLFLLPGPSLLNGLVTNPLLFFAMLLFIVLFSLANNPDIAIAPSFIIGFGLMIGVPVGMVTGAIDISSWSFAAWYLVATVIAWAVVLWLSRLLTRQNIVLSGKGA